MRPNMTQHTAEALVDHLAYLAVNEHNVMAPTLEGAHAALASWIEDCKATGDLDVVEAIEFLGDRAPAYYHARVVAHVRARGAAE